MRLVHIERKKTKEIGIIIFFLCVRWMICRPCFSFSTWIDWWVVMTPSAEQPTRPPPPHTVLRMYNKRANHFFFFSVNEWLKRFSLSFFHRVLTFFVTGFFFCCCWKRSICKLTRELYINEHPAILTRLLIFIFFFFFSISLMGVFRIYKRKFGYSCNLFHLVFHFIRR